MAKPIYFLLQAPLPQAEQEISPTPIENQIQEMEILKEITLSFQMPWSRGVELTFNGGYFEGKSNIRLEFWVTIREMHCWTIWYLGAINWLLAKQYW